MNLEDRPKVFGMYLHIEGFDNPVRIDKPVKELQFTRRKLTFRQKVYMNLSIRRRIAWNKIKKALKRRGA